MSLKAAYKLVLKVTERWAAPPNGRGPVFIHEIDTPKLEGTLSAGGGVPVLKVSSGAITLTGGAAVLDLTAAPHPSGTPVDLTGLRVQRIVLRARSTNTATVAIATDATNGYTIRFTETLAAADAVARSYANTLGLVGPSAKRMGFTSTDLDAIVDFVIVAG